MAERVAGQRRKLFRQLDHRLVREAGQHRVFELVELVFQCRVDARVGVAKQVDPPGADAVQVAAPLMVEQPGAFAVADGDQGYLFVVLHLGARVPDAGQAPCNPG